VPCRVAFIFKTTSLLMSYTKLHYLAYISHLVMGDNSVLSCRIVSELKMRKHRVKTIVQLCFHFFTL
jgi:hypothetical protein